MFVRGGLRGGRGQEMFVTGDRLSGVTGVAGDLNAQHGVVGVKSCHPVVGFGGAVGR